jgi:MHS family proline/betaine transporter-like MFS transporter
MSATSSASSLSSPAPSPARLIAAAIIGNMLELYDFVVYGFFATALAKAFFPTGDDVTSLLLAVATFGVGFVMRPLGAIVIGSYIDRAGRKAGLTLTILLMGVSTAMIGLAPTYAQIGVAAPLIIVAARLLQGFSLGGEVSGAIAYLVEQAPEKKRGFYGSWQQSGQSAAGILASFTGYLLGTMLSPEANSAWGWRVPFLIGLLIVPVGFYLRAKLTETPAFAEHLARGTQAKAPLAETFRLHGRNVLAGLGAVVIGTAAVYVFFIYMPTYAIRELKIPPATALLANGIGYVVMLVLSPITGAWSDKIGVKPLVIFATVAIGVVTLPLLAWVHAEPSLARLIAVQFVLAILLSFFTGPMPAMLARMFPTRVRSTGVAVAYNISVTIFGGFAPFIATWLIARTGNALAPGYYVAAAAVISFVSLLSIKDHWLDPGGG